MNWACVRRGQAGLFDYDLKVTSCVTQGTVSNGNGHLLNIFFHGTMFEQVLVII
jgi:hypothetical protein